MKFLVVIPEVPPEDLFGHEDSEAAKIDRDVEASPPDVIQNLKPIRMRFPEKLGKNCSRIKITLPKF